MVAETHCAPKGERNLPKADAIKPETIAVMTRSTFGVDVVPSQIQVLIDTGVKYGVVDHPLKASDLIWKAPKG